MNQSINQSINAWMDPKVGEMDGWVEKSSQGWVTRVCWVHIFKDL